MEVHYSAAVGQMLATLRESGLAASGGIHLLGLKSIRDRNPARWSFRKQQVLEFIERQFRRDFRLEDYLIPIDDAHVLLAQPGIEKPAAQARALHLLREVLEFFLGSAALEDVQISLVTQITQDGLAHEPLAISQRELDQAGLADTGAGQSLHPANERDAGLPPSVTRGLEVLHVIEPVWCIRRSSVASYYLRPLPFHIGPLGTVPTDLRTASVKECLDVDIATISHANDLLQRRANGLPATLHVPLHLASFSKSQGRRALFATLARARHLGATPLVCLRGLERGTPASTMIDICRSLEGVARGVIAIASDPSACVDRWREARLTAIGLDLSQSCGSRLPAREMDDFVRRAHVSTSSLIAYCVNDSATMIRAWSQGFSHISGDVVPRRAPDAPITSLLRPIDFYR